MTQFLTNEFLEQYPHQPESMTELGAFTAYRTYSRWLKGQGRRETWKEIAQRSVEYSMGIAEKQLVANGLPFDGRVLQMEAEQLFDNIFNTRQFLSGRTHWVGGADTNVADKFPLANFNCSFIEVVQWSDLSELFYLLLVGTGVGVKSTKGKAQAMGTIRDDVNLIHAEYDPLPKEQRIEKTFVTKLDNGFVKVYVGDSKEGWVEALGEIFTILTDKSHDDVHTIKVSYNSVRPKGERLNTFGGTASGHEPLRDMFDGIFKVIKGELDADLEPPYRKAFGTGEKNNRVYLRPIHILDIANLIGNNVVVGGVRRTAEIFLCDNDDWEVIMAKYGVNGIWDNYSDKGELLKSAEEKHLEVIDAFKKVNGYVPTWLEGLELRNPTVRPLFHRRMSNNSVAFETKPSREMLNLLFTIMQNEGEPGFVNLESANKRRPNAKGLNPCAEILLDSYGVCNLTTVNVMSFVRDGALDFSGLAEAQALSTRAGMRMTLLDLEIPHWNAVHKRDRLIGTSLTGWQDAMGALNYDKEQERQLLGILEEIVHETSSKYASFLRIPTPLLTTTVKPEGTLSQVAGGVSSGLHFSHSPYFIRRIRINANDALVRVAQELGWKIHAEVGTAGFNDVENLSKPEVIEQANTLVIDFPVKSDAKKTKNDVSVDEQFDVYFDFQEFYTQHNSSNTISVKPGEWERAEEIVWEKWDDFIGVSFLAHDGGSYTLAPYEEITEEQYNDLKASMKAFDPELLKRYEFEEVEEDLSTMEACDQGICPIR